MSRPLRVLLLHADPDPAPGLRALAEALLGLGSTVTVQSCLESYDSAIAAVSDCDVVLFWR